MILKITGNITDCAKDYKRSLVIEIFLNAASISFSGLSYTPIVVFLDCGISRLKIHTSEKTAIFKNDSRSCDMSISKTVSFSFDVRPLITMEHISNTTNKITELDTRTCKKSCFGLLTIELVLKNKFHHKKPSSLFANVLI